MSDDLARYVEGVAEGRRGTLVQSKRGRRRCVWTDGDGRGNTWFIKRGAESFRREVWRESRNARKLAAAGFGPRVLASGRYDGAEWLVAERVISPALDALSFDEAETALPALAAAIRRFHELGFVDPDLIGAHVFVARDGMRVIDTARVEQLKSSAPIDLRGRDLAALIFTTPCAWLLRGWRVRLVRDATLATGEELRTLSTLVDRGAAKLAARTRWRHEFVTLDDHFRRCLRSAIARPNEWSPSFDDLFERSLFTVVRTLPDRENRTLGRDASGRPLFFVKVFPPTKTGWSPAMREIAAIDLFQRAGILVNRLAAYAEDVDKGSMVAVKAAAGEPLDDLLRRGVSVAERRALAVQTARIWRRMRECGLRHRDAYPCHLFAAPWAREPLRFELRLIDMTRAGRAPFPKERWFVKDAAALWHGLPKPPVTRTDAVRWLREYFRIDRLDARAKRFARRVAAKEARIAARQARKSKR